ncbi:MAG: UDP-N-acetylmuramate--L-alanine ligase [Legionellales bacterium]|nr:UDP-N-acetylmuramate--L-alanine ligase [Legionellales bacterium]
MRRIKNIFMIGIGGAGMAGIAEVLLAQDYSVMGSDMKASSLTHYLENLGAKIFIGHQPQHVDGADVVVVSSAVKDDNPELIESKKKGIPVIRRAEMLAELMRRQCGIAIAGTHGKTTTTSLVSSLLTEAGLDPTFVIGGLLKSIGSNAKSGESHFFVAEADESDASFLYLKPTMSIVTNIDADHMSTYQGNFEKLKQTFIDFLQHLPFYGLAVLCYDDPHVRSIIPKLSRPIITYGFSADADIQALNFTQEVTQSRFVVNAKPFHKQFHVVLNLPGKHNVLNALAAITIALEVGVQTAFIQKCLAAFSGVGRRFQLYPLENDILLVDDYGHHPTEVNVTIQAARAAWPTRRLVMVFQPHRYTRTHDLFNDFINVLSEVDLLILLDVYPAGEKVIPGADGESLAKAIQKNQKVKIVFVPREMNLSEILLTHLQPNDVVITQGAGDIGSMTQHFLHDTGKKVEQV